MLAARLDDDDDDYIKMFRAVINYIISGINDCSNYYIEIFK